MGQTCGTNTGAVSPYHREIQAVDENLQTQTGPPPKCFRVTPDSGQFVGLIQGFNRRFEASACEVIYLPTNDNEAMDALTEILGKPEYCANFSIASGGHCYESLVYNSNVHAIIDVSLMDQVTRTDNQCEYSAEAGGTNWRLIKELYRKFGRVIPGGSCYSVGLGGHICGGGYGLLSRRDGLASDYLSGVDILCVDQNRKVSLKEIREDSGTEDEKLLLWACQGGGGGNFGLITRYYFKNLPAAPQYAYIETLSISWKELTRDEFKFLLGAFWEFVNDDEPYFAILKLMHISAGEIPITFQSVFDEGENDYVANISEFKKILEQKGIKLHPLSIPLIGHPSSNGILSVAQRMNWFEAAQTLNGSGPNQCGKYKSSYMRKPFPDHQCDALFAFLTMTSKCFSKLAADHPDVNNPKYEYYVNELREDPKLLDQLDFKQSLVQVDSYGAKINTKQSNATAIPQRSSYMKLQYQTYWAHDPNRKDAAEFNQFQDWIHRLWVDIMYEDVYSETGGLPDPYYQAKSNVQEEGGAGPIPDQMPYSSCVNPKIKPNSRVVDGAYYNYIDVDMVSWVKSKYKVTEKQAQEAVLRLYFEDNLDELVKAKKDWDPKDIFNHELSIPLELSFPL